MLRATLRFEATSQSHARWLLVVLDSGVGSRRLCREGVLPAAAAVRQRQQGRRRDTRAAGSLLPALRASRLVHRPPHAPADGPRVDRPHLRAATLRHLVTTGRCSMTTPHALRCSPLLRPLGGRSLRAPSRWAVAHHRHRPHDRPVLGTPLQHRSGHDRRGIAGNPALWYLTSAPVAGYRADVRTVPR